MAFVIWGKGEKMINDVLVPYVGEIPLCTNCTNYIFPNGWKNKFICWTCEDRRQKQIYEMLKLCERKEDAKTN